MPDLGTIKDLATTFGKLTNLFTKFVNKLKLLSPTIPTLKFDTKSDTEINCQFMDVSFKLMLRSVPTANNQIRGVVTFVRLGNLAIQQTQKLDLTLETDGTTRHPDGRVFTLPDQAELVLVSVFVPLLGLKP